MARYWIKLGHGDVTLTPVFTYFKKISDFTAVTPPTIFEFQNGIYYFDYIPTFEIICEIDAGAGVAVASDRYSTDIVSPNDAYLDEPISQVVNDVWNATTVSHVTAGTFGKLNADIKTYAQRASRVNEGHWKIFTTGPDVNRLVLYDSDGTTVIQKWDLKDSTGAASTTEIFERVPTQSVP